MISKLPGWTLFALVGILLALPAPARAFRDGAARLAFVPPGAEYVAERALSFENGAAHTAPRGFLARHGGSWIERLGGPTGDFRLIFGQGIPVVGADPGSAAESLAFAERFWRENADLLPAGVAPGDLLPWSNVLSRGIRFVSHRQAIGGVPVLGTGNFVAISKGRISVIGMRSFPVPARTAPLEAEPCLDPAEAEARAQMALAEQGVDAGAVRTELAYFPSILPDEIRFVLVFAVDLLASEGGRFTAFVDAGTGALVALRDDRFFLDGALRLSHHPRNPSEATTLSEAAFATVMSPQGNAVTALDGSFSIPGEVSSLKARLNGPFVDVSTGLGSLAELAVVADGGLDDGGVLDWAAADGGEMEQAQLDAFHFATIAREHAIAITEVDPLWFNQRLIVNVNQEADLNGDGDPDYCNAWSDGTTINFLPAGNMGGSYDCNNTAMVADILYHEYGHAVHIQSVIPGVGDFDGAASEGFADTMAVSMTHDHHIGPYFTKNGGSVRDVEPDAVWPDDDVQEVHQTGLIVGGAFWDLRKALVAELGEVEGHRVTDFLFTGAMATTSDVPSVYASVLLADDDNGDLTDGTPHFCTIRDAFSLHGLVSDLGRISIVHEPFAMLAPAAGPVPVEAAVRAGNADCTALGGVRLVYSLDRGGNWTTVPMARTTGDTFRGDLPALPEGTELRYRIEADETVLGDVITRPVNRAEPYYGVYVGELEEILCDDFETEDPAWTHELLEGEVRDGADDWQRKEPTGKAGDPPAAFSGVAVWGNDLVPEANWDGKYQASKTNTLRSPLYDLSAYDTVRLRFRRWLTVEDGRYDKARVYVNDQVVWANAATPAEEPGTGTLHHGDMEWILADLDITAMAAGKADVRIRFELASDVGLQFGGWNLDDFCLFGLEAETAPDGGADSGGADGDTDTDVDADAGQDAGDGIDAGADAGLTGTSGDCACGATGASGPAGPSLLEIAAGLMAAF